MSPKRKPDPLVSFDVLAGLAQELDAPLQSLAKTSQKLLERYKTRDFEYISYKDFKDIIGTLEQMDRQLKRCRSTTDRMLHLSAPKGHAAAHCSDVNAAVHEVIGLLGQQLQSARIRVLAHVHKGLPAVRIGKVELHQVLHNVLANAVQAMPAGGKIRVRTGLEAKKNMVFINVEDEGVGITPEHLSKVFEPFFTTKERGVEKSTGLGLSVVYAIVHAARGDVHIQSSLRKGTTVRIDLPVRSSRP